jgi:hypothetical protein
MFRCEKKKRSGRDTLQIDAGKRGWKAENNKDPVLTLPPLSSAERYLTLNEFEHMKLEHRVLNFKYSFQNRLCVQC